MRIARFHSLRMPRVLAICFRIFLIGLVLLLLIPAGRAQEQAAPAAAASPATSSESAVLEALAAKMADAISRLKAKSVVVFDFVTPDGKGAPLGPTLADQFNEALKKDARKFTVMGRLHPAAWDSIDFKCGESGADFQRARDSGAKLAVVGMVSLDGDTSTLSVQGVRVDKPKHTDTFRVQFPLTTELKELLQQPQEAAAMERPAKELSPTATVPAAGTLDFGFPRCDYCPRAEFSDEATQRKYQATVILLAVVDVDGTAKDITVSKCGGNGLDERALEAVRKWKFKPATDQSGKPVAVWVPIEIDFRLY